MKDTILKNISWRAIRVWQRNFDVYCATWKVNFVPPLLEPLLYLFAFGIGLGGLLQGVFYEGIYVSYLKFIAPGLVAMAVMNYGFFETTYASFVRMYFQKTYDAILSTPLTIEEVVLGELLWGATKSFFSAVVMLAVMSCFGLLPLSSALWMLPISLLAGMTFSSMGMCFTAIVKNIEMFNFPVFLLITPMFLLSGIFFPLSTLPLWIQKIILVFPLTLLVSSFRALAMGNFDMQNFFEIAIVGVAGVVCMFWSLVMMKKRLIK